MEAWTIANALIGVQRAIVAEVRAEVLAGRHGQPLDHPCPARRRPPPVRSSSPRSPADLVGLRAESPHELRVATDRKSETGSPDDL